MSTFQSNIVNEKPAIDVKEKNARKRDILKMFSLVEMLTDDDSVYDLTIHVVEKKKVREK